MQYLCSHDLDSNGVLRNPQSLTSDKVIRLSRKRLRRSLVNIIKSKKCGKRIEKRFVHNLEPK